MSEKKKVCIVGSGNWGTTVAIIIGENVSDRPDLFDSCVKMFVFEEMVQERTLTDIINEKRENVKYLPGIKIPDTVIACSSVVETAHDADIIIFVTPHQFIKKVCETLKGKIKSTAIGISLIKGFVTLEGGGIDLITHLINRILSIECSVLMGANIANEVAAKNYGETTIGCNSSTSAHLLKTLLERDYFNITVVGDTEAVELCGSLKNIVACGAGFSDGFGYNERTKVAIIRLGLKEMMKFAQSFYGSTKIQTFFESCGVADLIATCYGGRNRKVAEAFIKTKKRFDELEEELLKGQKLQGPMTAAEVNHMLKNLDMENEFPLFTAVHKVCTYQVKPEMFLELIKDHPEYE